MFVHLLPVKAKLATWTGCYKGNINVYASVLMHSVACFKDQCTNFEACLIAMATDRA